MAVAHFTSGENGDVTAARRGLPKVKRFPRSSTLQIGGLRDGKPADFVSSLASGDWSHCDAPAEAARFIAERVHGRENRTQTIERVWADGNGMMRGEARSDWSGDPRWGGSRNTRIKVLVS